MFELELEIDPGVLSRTTINNLDRKRTSFRLNCRKTVKPGKWDEITRRIENDYH